MVRSLSDDTDCFKSFKFSAVTLKFFYFSKTYNRILKSLSTFHDEKWLSNRREKLILNVIKQRTNQFLINSSLLLLLFSVMHISFVWTIKNGLSRIQKRSLLNTDRKKYANFFARLWMCELQQWPLYKSYEVLGTAKNSKLKSW